MEREKEHAEVRTCSIGCAYIILYCPSVHCDEVISETKKSITACSSKQGIVI